MPTSTEVRGATGMTSPRDDAIDVAPLLTIVIPAYNVAPYVRAAVESALAQTYSDLEVIAVDDGSTDATPTVLESTRRASGDPRLRIVRQQNAGLAGARNTGIFHARGTFIGFLDADDVWLPDKAELQIAMMQGDSSIGLSFSDSEYLTEDGCATGSILQAAKVRPTLHDMIRRNHVGNGSAAIVRRECFDTAGLFRPELRSCEDYEMWCRILDRTTFRAQSIPRPLTLYRVRETSLSFDTMRFVENADQAIACLREEMPGVPERVIRAGHAEHYRIAAWKAISSGRSRDGFTLMARAARLRPLLLLADWRAFGTLVALVVPRDARGWLARKVKALARGGKLHEIQR